MFTLRLGGHETFTWTFTGNDQPQSVAGVYTLRENNRIVQPDTGGPMLRTITPKDVQTLEFAPIVILK